MTQAEADKLIDELIDMRDERDHARQLLSDAINRYEEVALALGCATYIHSNILARAKELARFARVA